MKGLVGRIYGNAGSTEFNFVVLEPKEVKRTDYIKVWNDSEGWVVAQVLDVIASTDLKETDVLKGRDAEREIYIAKAYVIGKRDENGLLRVPKTPFVPGENVFKAEKELIVDVLGLEKDGIYLGLIEDTDIRVNLDVNSLVQKHCCILAKTGSGKSYTAGVIIEELIERGVPLFIIDPHGEYASLKEPNRDEEEKMKIYGISPKGYGNKVRVYVPPNSPFANRADGILRLDGLNLSAEEIIELAGITNTTQQALLYQALKNLKGQEYTIEDIIDEVEQIKHSAKVALLGSLEKILESGLFGRDSTPVDILLQKERAIVLDMRGTPPEHQDLIVSRVCAKLFELRKREEVPPGMIVIEEAHNFIPERGMGKAVSTQVLRTIASEGRKFGLGLLVISQRPARVDKNVISQCNTQIILRVTNPNDLNAIKKGVEGLTAEMVDEIKRLPPGTALVVNPELENPIIVNIRTRKSRHGGASVSVVKGTEKKKRTERTAKVRDVKDKKEAKKEKKDSKKKSRKGFLRRMFG
ncbi:putative ATPase [Archaeoglobus sulfaticallidus PM70-1]|uniref:Putative ATPase n=1 Tax=Archaeoglobus sulfaticallidus PM70-1 TaxID=387631 RepID=N0BKH3_9EURY|nr:ATP-binding protein [Archaeoglobus sulfaticallidus]AGK60685.1 putative ATPase [Archaeoglobus sulfaticallidus PM70-1]